MTFKINIKVYSKIYYHYLIDNVTLLILCEYIVDIFIYFILLVGILSHYTLLKKKKKFNVHSNYIIYHFGLFSNTHTNLP